MLWWFFLVITVVASTLVILKGVSSWATMRQERKAIDLANSLQGPAETDDLGR